MLLEIGEEIEILLNELKCIIETRLNYTKELLYNFIHDFFSFL